MRRTTKLTKMYHAMMDMVPTMRDVESAGIPTITYNATMIVVTVATRRAIRAERRKMSSRHSRHTSPGASWILR